MSLVLTPQFAVLASMQGRGGAIAWRRLGEWESRRSRATFFDAFAGRTYTADLDYPTLGGTWSGRVSEGGWWCARRPEEPAVVERQISGASPEFSVPPLVPDRMASPRYPLQAIRQAREGEAVVCFLVDQAGIVQDPVVVSVTDEIFEATTLSAIGRTRYRPVRTVDVVRPGCRSYSYSLDLIDE